MFKERKMLAMMFLLFIIVVSLVFSGFFSNMVEGMTNDDGDGMTDEMMFKKLSNDKDTITLDDFTMILSQHPEIKELLKSKLSATDSSSDETDIPMPDTTENAAPDDNDDDNNNDGSNDNNSPNTESFVTKLTPSDYDSNHSQLTTPSKPTATKAKSNKVFERTFEMSNPQPFNLQKP